MTSRQAGAGTANSSGVRGFMADLWREPLIQAAVSLAIVAVLTIGAVYGVKKWRDRAEKDRPHASDLLTKFRELHARGSLSDEEFRTIKTKLAAQLDQELSKSDDS